MLSLLDLDAPTQVDPYEFLQDFKPDTDKIAKYAYAAIILQVKLTPPLWHSQKAMELLQSLVRPVQEASRQHLRFPKFKPYPVICEKCFHYFGDITGGHVFKTRCIYCPPDVDNIPYCRYYGIASHYINREELWHGEQTTILTSQLLYLFFRKD